MDDLQTRLECALERVQDAEEGAMALLDENAEILGQVKTALASIAMLQKELASAKRGAAISFSFGAVSFGAGVPLITAGITTDNSTMLWSGAGVMA